MPLETKVAGGTRKRTTGTFILNADEFGVPQQAMVYRHIGTYNEDGVPEGKPGRDDNPISINAAELAATEVEYNGAKYTGAEVLGALEKLVDAIDGPRQEQEIERVRVEAETKADEQRRAELYAEADAKFEREKQARKSKGQKSEK